jgi:hypothetical protein
MNFGLVALLENLNNQEKNRTTSIKINLKNYIILSILLNKI